MTDAELLEAKQAEIIALTAERDALIKQKQEIALQALSDAGQAFDAHEAQLKAEAERDALADVLREVIEINEKAWSLRDESDGIRKIARLSADALGETP